MPLLTIVPPMPGAERRFQPFVDFVQTCGWETEFVRLEWPGHQHPAFGSTEIFPQVDAQTAGKVVMGFSMGALYAHLGALRARHPGRDFKPGGRCAGSAVGAGPGGQKGLGWSPDFFAQRSPAPAPAQPCG